MAFIQNQIGRSPSYGYIYMNTGNFTGVTFAYTTSYQELTSLGTNFTLLSTAQDFAMTTDGRLKYTGALKKRFEVDAILLSSANPEYLSVQLYKNGSALTNGEVYAASSLRIMSFPVDMVTNDYLSLFAKIQNAGSVAITGIMLSANSTARIL